MIDVSSYQGVIEWEKVRADGVTHAYIKATEGMTRVDETMARNLVLARAAGVVPGLYHYGHPSNPPHKEAAFFLECAYGHLLTGDLRPALDLEVTEGHSWEYLNDWKAQWLAVVDQHVGALCTFYSYWYFWKKMTLYEARPVWGAYVGKAIPAGTEWTIWQYSFTGRVDGIRGAVDLDRPLKPLPLIP